jgi:hypothetical protein
MGTQTGVAKPANVVWRDAPPAGLVDAVVRRSPKFRPESGLSFVLLRHVIRRRRCAVQPLKGQTAVARKQIVGWW